MNTDEATGFGPRLDRHNLEMVLLAALPKRNKELEYGSVSGVCEWETLSYRGTGQPIRKAAMRPGKFWRGS